MDSSPTDITAVIHVASPFTGTVNDPKKDMLDPAIEGTMNVVRSTHNAGINRIIITSSFVAVFDLAYGGKINWEESKGVVTCAELSIWSRSMEGLYLHCERLVSYTLFFTQIGWNSELSALGTPALMTTPSRVTSLGSLYTAHRRRSLKRRPSITPKNILVWGSQL